MKKDLLFFIKKYLAKRPLFFSLIRPFEALLLYQHKKYLKTPIMDFGCGDGFFAELVFDEKKIAVGLDLETSRTKEAKKRRTYKKLVFYDSKRIPFGNAYFKSIFANSVLEHLSELESNLQEINRVLQKNGFLLVTVMTDKWQEYLLGSKIFGDLYRRKMKTKQEHHNLLSYKGWRSIFIKAGFEIVDERGYLDKFQSALMDLAHYLSFPSLLSYLLVGKWVLWPKWYKLFFLDKIVLALDNQIQTDIKEAAAVFYLLKKIK